MGRWLAAMVACAVAATARAETRIERGRYLVEAVGACGNCHSPVDGNGTRNGPALSGGPALLSPAFVAYAPNITSDPRTGIGSWSEDQIVDALREGGRRTAGCSDRPCPFRSTARCRTPTRTPSAYLKTLPPTERETPSSTYKAPMPSSYGPPVGSVSDPPHDDHVAYGAYLAKLGHCMQCHTPIGPDGKRDFANRSGAGGLSVDISWGSRVAANITPDPDTGLGRWTDDEIVAALSRGLGKDGAPLSPIMPWPYFHAMRPEDLKAVVAWLRTLKPVPNAVLR